jgi:hypothetical protein
MLCAQPGACREESRGENAGVVEDEQIARSKQRGQIAEVVVHAGARASIDPEHAAGAANLRRMLRDEVFGQIEMKVGD